MELSGKATKIQTIVCMSLFVWITKVSSAFLWVICQKLCSHSVVFKVQMQAFVHLMCNYLLIAMLRQEKTSAEGIYWILFRQLENVCWSRIAGRTFSCCCFWSGVHVGTSRCAPSAPCCCVSAGCTSPSHLPHCLLADAPHSDMCVPAHLFSPHYCQACVNKYPGVEHSSVPVLHHRGAQSAGRPSPVQQGWQEPWLHCKHCSYSPSAQTLTLHSILSTGTPTSTHAALTHILTEAHTHWQTNTYRYLVFHSHYFFPFSAPRSAGGMLPYALCEEKTPAAMFCDYK